MKTEQPLKRWSITAVLADAGLSFSRHESAITPLGTAGSSLSPVEYLLLATAGCMALSIKAEALARAQPFSSVRVIANGTKAAGAPSRLGGIELRILLGTRLSPSEAEQVLAGAKRLCTVTNTIATAPPITATLTEGSEAQEAAGLG